MRKRFNADDMSSALEFIRDRLSALKLTSKQANQAELMCEESLTKLLEHADFTRNKFIQVNIRKLFGDVKIELIVPGSEFNFAENIETIMQIQTSEDEDDSPAINNIILRSFGDRINYRHSGKFNSINVRAVRSPYYGLYQTLAAVILAIILGLTARIFFPSLSQSINDNILSSVRQIFMNGLNMCAVPIVFCSIASCIANFGSMSGIRRTGSILMSAFVVSSLIAVMISFGILRNFKPSPEFTEYLSTVSAASTEISPATSLSLKEMITGLMPSNIVRSFMNANMLQIIVIAVFVGISTWRTRAKNFRAVIDECGSVFMDIMGILVRMTPLIIFCSIASLIITTGLSVISSFVNIFFLFLASYLILFAVQILSVFLFCRLNPFVMLRKAMPMIATAFTTCSSTAALSDSIKAAESLGVSPKLYSFAIPLGIAINKNGLSAFLGFYTMLAANVYGIDMPVSKMIMFAFTIIILVAASPGVAGSGITVIATLYAQLGSPLEIFMLVMVINPVLDTIDTVTTCMGNLISVMITARRENMLDIGRYYE